MNVLFSLNLAIVIFMLASLLLGCVLGLSGSFIKDASSAVKNIMNQIDQINYDKLYLLDICINGNGSLAHYNYLSSFNKSGKLYIAIKNCFGTNKALYKYIC